MMRSKSSMQVQFSFDRFLHEFPLLFRLKREAKDKIEIERLQIGASHPSNLFRTDTVDDIRKLRSSFQKFQASRAKFNKDLDEEKETKLQTAPVGDPNAEKGKKD